MTKEIWLHNDHAECYEMDKGSEPNEPGLRLWCTMFPDAWTLQIRTHAPINGCYGNGKPRNMIAHLTVTVDQLRDILRQMEEYGNT